MKENLEWFFVPENEIVWKLADDAPTELFGYMSGEKEPEKFLVCGNTSLEKKVDVIKMLVVDDNEANETRLERKIVD